jgi:hypothetical protein
MSAPLPRVVAVIAAFNEADIIGQVIDHLAHEGVWVHLIDDGSTDGTAEAAEQRLGQNVVAVERLADTSRYSLRAILRRKSELAQAIDADWIIAADADEFRESPWLGTTLQQAIGIVDALGYNAVDFEALSFFPTTDAPLAGADVRAALTHYEPGASLERVNVSCWRAGRREVDLVSSGGLDVAFAGRSVFPLPFLLRHYPLRDQLHAERKIFVERLPRFDPDERRLGWHRQYDGLRPGQRFVRSPASLLRFDPLQARIHLALRNRDVEALEQRWRGRFEEQHSEAERQSDALRERLSALDKEHAVLAQAGGELDERLRAALRERDAARDSRAHLAESAGELEQRLRAALRERDAARESTTTLARALDEARDSRALLAESAGEIERQLRAVVRERDEARKDAAALAHERDEARDRRAVVAESAGKLEQRLRAALRERDEARKNAAALARERDEARDGRAQLAESAGEIDRRLRAALQALDEAGHARARAEQHARAREDELVVAGVELAGMHDALTQARHQLQTLRDAQEELARARDELRAAERRLAFADEDRDVATRRAATLELQLQQAKRALLDGDAERRRGDEALAAAREEVRRHQQALTEAQSALGRINELETRLREVHMSLSWQLTQPVRAALAQLDGKRKGEEP